MLDDDLRLRIIKLEDQLRDFKLIDEEEKSVIRTKLNRIDSTLSSSIDKIGHFGDKISITNDNITEMSNKVKSMTAKISIIVIIGVTIFQYLMRNIVFTG